MLDYCFYAHFNPRGRVEPYVWECLAALKQAGFSTVFVSASALPEASQDRLRELCADLMMRENKGLDFGSWSAAFRIHGPAIGGRLLLLNDSVYGPFVDLAQPLAKLQEAGADFCGMVESLELSPHLQSWFVLLENRVVRHPAFAAVMAREFAAMDKKNIIRAGEVSLTTELVKAGLRYTAFYRPQSGGLIARSFPFNPMHFLWREMIEAHGIPFLKVELLRDNPAEVGNLADVWEVMQRAAPHWGELIQSHQQDAARRNSGTRPSRLRIWAGRLRYGLIARDHRLNRTNHRRSALVNYWLFSVWRAIAAGKRAVERLTRTRDQ